MQDGENPIASGAASAKPAVPKGNSRPTMAEIAAAANSTHMSFDPSAIGFNKKAAAPVAKPAAKPAAAQVVKPFVAAPKISSVKAAPTEPIEMVAPEPEEKPAPEPTVLAAAKAAIAPDASAVAPEPELNPSDGVQPHEELDDVYPEPTAGVINSMNNPGDNIAPIKTSSFNYQEEATEESVENAEDLSEPLENSLLEDLPEGTMITGVAPEATAEPDAANAPLTPATEKAPEKKKSKAGLVLGVILILLLAGGAIAYAILNNKPTDVTANTNTEEATQEPVAEEPVQPKRRRVTKTEEETEEQTEEETQTEEVPVEETPEPEDTTQYIDLSKAGIKIKLPDDGTFIDYRIAGNKLVLWAATKKDDKAFNPLPSDEEEAEEDEGAEATEEGAEEKNDIPLFANKYQNIDGMATIQWWGVQDSSDFGTSVHYKDPYYFIYKGAQGQFSAGIESEADKLMWESESAMYLIDWFSDSTNYVDLETEE